MNTFFCSHDNRKSLLTICQPLKHISDNGAVPPGRAGSAESRRLKNSGREGEVGNFMSGSGTVERGHETN